jgi:tRNA pseudouridine38-40 synthase
LCLGEIQLPRNRLYSWHVPYSLNIEVMREAAAVLIGPHDFAAFCNVSNHAYESTVREIYRVAIVKEERRLRIEIEGNHFLYRMARNIVGTLVSVGRGKMSVVDVMMLLKSRDRTLGGVTAPAHGLILKSIKAK